MCVEARHNVMLVDGYRATSGIYNVGGIYYLRFWRSASVIKVLEPFLANTLANRSRYQFVIRSPWCRRLTGVSRASATMRRQYPSPTAAGFASEQSAETGSPRQNPGALAVPSLLQVLSSTEIPVCPYILATAARRQCCIRLLLTHSKQPA